MVIIGSNGVGLQYIESLSFVDKVAYSARAWAYALTSNDPVEESSASPVGSPVAFRVTP